MSIWRWNWTQDLCPSYCQGCLCSGYSADREVSFNPWPSSSVFAVFDWIVFIHICWRFTGCMCSTLIWYWVHIGCPPPLCESLFLLVPHPGLSRSAGNLRMLTLAAWRLQPIGGGRRKGCHSPISLELVCHHICTIHGFGSVKLWDPAIRLSTIWEAK